jgi:hypothetical protein
MPLRIIKPVPSPSLINTRIHHRVTLYDNNEKRTNALD